MVIILTIDKIIKNELKGIDINSKNFKLDSWIIYEIREFLSQFKNSFLFFISNYYTSEAKFIGEYLGFKEFADPYLASVLYNANKPKPEPTFQLLQNYANDMDPDCPMIHLEEDRWDFLLITDDKEDIAFGNNLKIRTILLDYYYFGYPRKSLSLDEITIFIKLSEIINRL